MLQRYGFSPVEPKRKGEGLATGVLSTQDPQCSPELSHFRCQVPGHEALALAPVPFGDGCGQAALSGYLQSRVSSGGSFSLLDQELQPAGQERKSGSSASKD